MEPEIRNKPKWYVLSFSDGKTPPKVVHGWRAVMDERNSIKAKVTAKGFHTEEMARRFAGGMVSGNVTFQNNEKPHFKIEVELV